MFTQFIPNEEEMLALGARLAKICVPPLILFLHGNLGAGKTTFTRGFLRGLNYNGLVKSPTYTLVETYPFEKQTIYHFDFYRIKDTQELEYIGLQDYFHPQAICLIEWPEQGAGLLPLADLSCYIETNHSGRDVKMIANSDSGNDILTRLEK